MNNGEMPSIDAYGKLTTQSFYGKAKNWNPHNFSNKVA